MGTLCCSSECERYLGCELADINHLGTHTVEPFLSYGSGTFSDDGTCVIEYWCGELGNWKMFKPVDKDRDSYTFRGKRAKVNLYEDCDWSEIDDAEILRIAQKYLE